MNKAQQRLDKMEKNINSGDYTLEECHLLLKEKQDILLRLKEAERIKEIWLKDHNKIVADWKKRYIEAKQEGRKEASIILFDKFEKLVKECCEKGLATEMIIIEGLPNLRKEMEEK